MCCSVSEQQPQFAVTEVVNSTKSDSTSMKFTIWQSSVKNLTVPQKSGNLDLNISDFVIIFVFLIIVKFNTIILVMQTFRELFLRSY
jgi:hypothetical protein